MSDAVHTDGSPTVVLVHAAFADGSSWNGVIERLQAQAVTVTAPANPVLSSPPATKPRAATSSA